MMRYRARASAEVRGPTMSEHVAPVEQDLPSGVRPGF